MERPQADRRRTIYRATDADVARMVLEDFDAGVRGRRCPAISQSWRRNWEHVIPLFAFPSLCGASFTPRMPSNP